MFYNAKSGSIKIENISMDYIVFGTGKKNLVLLPGLGDGLRSMKGLALPVALMYRQYAKEYRVYVFSRRNILPTSFSTREMAKDVIYALDTLAVEKADFVGVSQGGMIAQWCAIEASEKVNKLVLVVSCAKRSKEMEKSISIWKKMAIKGDYKALLEDNVRNMYTDTYIQKNIWMVPFMAKISKPASFDRFITMADACLTHDSFHDLHRIKAETLVIGGRKDQTLGIQGTLDLSEGISNCKTYIYPEYGHALYEEAKDFNDRILTFLRESQ